MRLASSTTSVRTMVWLMAELEAMHLGQGPKRKRGTSDSLT